MRKKELSERGSLERSAFSLRAATYTHRRVARVWYRQHSFSGATDTPPFRSKMRTLAPARRCSGYLPVAYYDLVSSTALGVFHFGFRRDFLSVGWRKFWSGGSRYLVSPPARTQSRPRSIRRTLDFSFPLQWWLSTSGDAAQNDHDSKRYARLRDPILYGNKTVAPGDCSARSCTRR